jgi:hypothetical protein
MKRNALTLTPAPVMSAADKAAHAAASYVRAHAGDSDPDMDEALKRVRSGSTFDAALHRLQTEVAYIERDAQLAADVAKDLAANDDDAPDANWIPYIPAPTQPAEDYWDEAIDAYGTRVWPMTLPSAA